MYSFCSTWPVEFAWVLPVQGKEVQGEVEGILAMKQSWPSIMRTLYGDHKRYEETYFSAYKVRFSISLVSTVNVIIVVIIVGRSMVWLMAESRTVPVRVLPSTLRADPVTLVGFAIPREDPVALLSSVGTLTSVDRSSSKVLGSMLRTTVSDPATS